MEALTGSTAAARRLPITDVEGLRAALTGANLPTLLMVHTHLTGDEAFLLRFSAHIHSPYSMSAASVPAELEQELRDRLFALLTQDPALPPVEISPDLMRKMMSINVAEEVEEEFIPLLMEQMGFEQQTPRVEIAGRPMPPAGFKVVVIGAGMTGIAAAIKLADAGYDHVVLEKNEEVGGTWYENRYPGVGVDTPSHFYSYSFAINTEWNHYHPKGHDMQDYLLTVARKYGLHDRTLFGTRALSCTWLEDEHLWEVLIQTRDEAPRIIKANAVINSQGPLNRWSLPNIPGLGDFQGPAMHTAAWNTDVDVTGKDVVMIGTGASGHQLAVALALSARHLTICQRSRHWLMRNPEVGVPVSDAVKFALRHMPHYKEWFRFRVYWFAGDGLFVNVLKDPNWPDQDVSVSAHNEAMRQFALSHLQTSLADRPDLLEKLLPDHPIFSKRVLQDEGWLDTVKRDNVTLETGAIDHIEADAVVMQDGTRHHADILALATGFDVARMLGSLKVVGRAGADLGEAWGEEDPRAYLGVTVPGYPNFFMTVGPNSAPNHAAGQNLVSECQIHYIIECLDVVVAQGARAIEPRVEPYEEWNARLDERMKDMIWTHPKANSYYNNSRGRIYMSWPYRLIDQWVAMRGPDLDHFIVA